MARSRSWDQLSAGSKRRYNAAAKHRTSGAGFRLTGEDLYASGAKLSRSERGHGYTPNTPRQALADPLSYPGYTGRHRAELNELARQRGQRAYGEGPRGKEAYDAPYREVGDFTQIHPMSAFDLRDWRASAVFRTPEEAQQQARQSNAPAGVVQIADRGEGTDYRYVLMYGYPEQRTSKRKQRGGRFKSRVVTERENMSYLSAYWDRP